MSTGVLTSVVSDSRKIRSCVSCGDAADRGRVRVGAADAELADGQVAGLRAGLRVDPDVGLDRVRGDVVGRRRAVDERAGVGDLVADLERGLLARVRVARPRGAATLGMTNFVQ